MVRVINNSKEKQKIARFVLEALRQGDGSSQTGGRFFRLDNGTGAGSRSHLTRHN